MLSLRKKRTRKKKKIALSACRFLQCRHCQHGGILAPGSKPQHTVGGAACCQLSEQLLCAPASPHQCSGTHRVAPTLSPVPSAPRTRELALASAPQRSRDSRLHSPSLLHLPNNLPKLRSEYVTSMLCTPQRLTPATPGRSTSPSLFPGATLGLPSPCTPCHISVSLLTAAVLPGTLFPELRHLPPCLPGGLSISKPPLKGVSPGTTLTLSPTLDGIIYSLIRVSFAPFSSIWGKT